MKHVKKWREIITDLANRRETPMNHCDDKKEQSFERKPSSPSGVIIHQQPRTFYCATDVGSPIPQNPAVFTKTQESGFVKIISEPGDPDVFSESR